MIPMRVGKDDESNLRWSYPDRRMSLTEVRDWLRVPPSMNTQFPEIAVCRD
jgi:hypothetical protein